MSILDAECRSFDKLVTCIEDEFDIMTALPLAGCKMAKYPEDTKAIVETLVEICGQEQLDACVKSMLSTCTYSLEAVGEELGVSLVQAQCFLLFLYGIKDTCTVDYDIEHYIYCLEAAVGSTPFCSDAVAFIEVWSDDFKLDPTEERILPVFAYPTADSELFLSRFVR
jgi:hypothetical protein